MVSMNVKCRPGSSFFSVIALQMMGSSGVLETTKHHIYKLYPRCFGLLLPTGKVCENLSNVWQGREFSKA